MALAPRIPREPIARSLVKAEAKKNRTAQAHVDLVKHLTCCATGKAAPSESHHLMRQVDRGMSFKAAGRYVIPLSNAVHMEITPHGDPEAVLMARYGIDARSLADALWAASPDLYEMQRAVFNEHQRAALRMRAA